MYTHQRKMWFIDSGHDASFHEHVNGNSQYVLAPSSDVVALANVANTC